MVRNAKKWSDGQASAEGTRCAMAISLEDVADDGTRIVKLAWSSLEGPEDVPAPGTFAEALDDLGKTPLPPYMRRAAVEADKEDYQTVFAMSPGSVAAPTAGLHYDDLLLEEMEGAGLGLQRLTLHVGAGTFKPLGEGDIMAHEMHAERCIVTREALTMMRDQHRNDELEDLGKLVLVGRWPQVAWPLVVEPAPAVALWRIEGSGDQMGLDGPRSAGPSLGQCPLGPGWPVVVRDAAHGCARLHGQDGPGFGDQLPPTWKHLALLGCGVHWRGCLEGHVRRGIGPRVPFPELRRRKPPLAILMAFTHKPRQMAGLAGSIDERMDQFV
jgi:hypothetical protein